MKKTWTYYHFYIGKYSRAHHIDLGKMKVPFAKVVRNNTFRGQARHRTFGGRARHRKFGGQARQTILTGVKAAKSMRGKILKQDTCSLFLACLHYPHRRRKRYYIVIKTNLHYFKTILLKFVLLISYDNITIMF